MRLVCIHWVDSGSSDEEAFVLDVNAAPANVLHGKLLEAIKAALGRKHDVAFSEYFDHDFLNGLRISIVGNTPKEELTVFYGT